MTPSEEINTIDPPTPASQLLSRKVLETNPETGEVKLSFFARPEFANRHGTVSGGNISAMLDSTTAIPAYVLLPKEFTAVTKELTVAFLRPAPLGPLFATARLIERNEREARTEGELLDPEGNVLARGKAVMRILRRTIK